MSWLLAICISCFGAELFLRLPIVRTASGMSRDGARASRIILSRSISDHWKEKMALFYARQMGRQTLLLTFHMTIFVLALVAGIRVLDVISPHFGPFVSSPLGLSFTALVSVLYFPVKRRLVRS